MKRRPRTAEEKLKLSISNVGNISPMLGLKHTEIANRKNMITHLPANLSLKEIDKYQDFEMLKLLTRRLSKFSIDRRKDKNFVLSFLDKFYFDCKFNDIYEKWIKSNKNKWCSPTVDHKISKSMGGNDNIDNLQFLTWFENRAKAEMSDTEWENFKIKTNTKSDLFI